MAGNLPLPMMCTNWGFQSDWNASMDGLVANCKKLGVKSVAVRIYSTSVAQRKALKEKGGFQIAGWENLSQFDYRTLDPEGLDAIMPQIESVDQRNKAFEAFKANWGGTRLRSICTTYSGLENGEYSLFQPMGVKGCYVECYAADDQPGIPIHSNLDRMINQGVAYKIPLIDLVPLCGTYRNEFPTAYTGLSVRGDQIGIYLAEPMAPDTWNAWSKLTKPAEPPVPVVVNSSDANMDVVNDTERWLSQQSDMKPLSRLRIEQRIALSGVNPTSDDTARWVRAAPQIKAVLDKEGIST